MRTVLMAASLLLLTAIAGCRAGDKAPSDQERQEIADTLEGFAEAFGNADTAALGAYWSQACSAEEKLSNQAAAVFFGNIWGVQRGGEYDLTVDVDRLVIEVVDEEHVTVPLEQPEGAVSATVTVNLEVPQIGRVEVQDNPLTEPLLFFEVPLGLVNEDGTWKVGSCVLSVNDGEEEEEEEAR